MSLSNNDREVRPLPHYQRAGVNKPADKTMEVKELVDNVMRKYPTARRIAVENVVISWPRESALHNSMNLAMDARLYNWSRETVSAIKYGMELAGIPH